jgi:nucleoside-diphosphate-sugar epimerase
MKSVVVTGAAGRLGRLTVKELLDHGYSVCATDRVPPPSPLGCRFLPAELTSAASVYNLFRGAEAVIHHGAIPGPSGHPQPVTFENNVLSTYNVLEAAGVLGLRKAVFASTVFTLGWVEEADRYWPRYVPIDEAHPLTPFEAYGLSKVIGEEIAGAVSRRTGMSIVSLRIMNVIQESGYSVFPWPAPTREKPVRFVIWPYVDARDVARASRLALKAETSGHEPVFIAARETRFDVPTETLLQTLAPQAEIRRPLEGCESVISIERARELLGWQPQHSWREELSGQA